MSSKAKQVLQSVSSIVPPTNFQKWVIVIGIIVLIIGLVAVAISYRSLNKKRVFPPDIAECPDYFEVVAPKKCKNVKNMGNGTCAPNENGYYDFSQYGNSPEDIKSKNKEAMRCGWEWDGITNNPIVNT